MSIDAQTILNGLHRPILGSAIHAESEKSSDSATRDQAQVPFVGGGPSMARENPAPVPSRILVFDGDCVLCSRSVAFVLRHDHRNCYRFATTQSPSGNALLVAHGLDPQRPTSVLLVEATTAYTESSAMLRALSSFGGAWHALAICLRIIPRFVRDPLYRWVARHRYRWFGRRDTCYLPTPENAARFLH